MDSPARINRQHYGRVVAIAFGLLAASLLLDALHLDLSTGHTDQYWQFYLFVSAFIGLFFGGVLLLWLAAIWGIFSKFHRWRGRTWMALLPMSLMLIHTCAKWIREPPSLQRHFRFVFDADMPVNARNIDIIPSTFGDNSTHYTFSCSKEGTEKLIRDMSLEGGPGPLMYHRINPHLDSPLRQQPEADLLSFARSDHRGFGWVLITNRGMTDVFVVQDPAYTRPDDAP
ncbi:MAG: hypothetical protein ACO1TE_07005 [Prosthecobacter sp.]